MDRQIGSYELLERIGHGATSDVHRARHRVLGREAAVKVLLARLAEREPACTMFLRESRLVARLDHPNVVRVYEAGEHDGALYIAMELVEGRDLRSVLDERGRLPLDETLDVVRQVAAALDAAHAAGLVHRDVKPSNVLLASDGSGRVVLTDFGLTTALDSSTRVSGAGHLVGSIPYMPPEQLEGRPVTPRSDVYSLACVVYECLTGRPPFPRASDVEVLWAHVRDVPALPSASDPALRAVDRAVLHGLAKSPEDRPASAGELVDCLTGARHCGRDPRSRRLVRLLAAAAGAVTLLPVLLGGGGGRPDPAPGRSQVVAGPAAAAPATTTRSGATRPADAGTPGATTGSNVAVVARVEGSATRHDEARPTERARSSAAGPPAVVAAAPPRVEGLPYDATPVVECGQGTPEQVGCVQLEVRPDERSIHVAIRDATRLPVRAWIRQDVDRDGDFDGDWVELCAQTERPVPVQPGALVNISLETGRCATEGRSVPTNGLVTVSLFGSS